jgi:hypothetical protein
VVGGSVGWIDGIRIAEGNGPGDGDSDGANDSVAVGSTMISEDGAGTVGMAANCVGLTGPDGRADRSTATAPPTRSTTASRTAPIPKPPGMPPRPARSGLC